MKKCGRDQDHSSCEVILGHQKKAIDRIRFMLFLLLEIPPGYIMQKWTLAPQVYIFQERYASTLFMLFPVHPKPQIHSGLVLDENAEARTYNKMRHVQGFIWVESFSAGYLVTMKQTTNPNSGEPLTFVLQRIMGHFSLRTFFQVSVM